MKLFFNLLLIFCCLLSNNIQAQNADLNFSITVVNEQRQPIENATVELRMADQKNLVKGAITDQKGIADFKVLTEGNMLPLLLP